MKKTLLLILVVVFAFSSISCGTSAGDEIADFTYTLDKGDDIQNYSYNKGLSALKDLIQGIYDAPGDITEMGRPITKPIVEFDNEVCMSAGNVKLLTRMYYYLMCEFKYTEISQSYDFAIKAEDTPAYWNSLEVDSYKTIRQVVEDKVAEIAKIIVACELAYKDYGLVKSDLWKASYDNAVNNVFGNVEAINEYYAAYGLNNELLIENYKNITLYNELYEHLVGIDGMFYPTDAQSEKFFEDECLYIEQIVFPYVEINDFGYNVYKSDEKIKEAKSKGEALYELIKKDPKQFDRNMFQTEHPEWSENRDGYVYTPDSVIPEILNACKSVGVGEIIAIDTPIGYYIIRNLEKTDVAFEKDASKIVQSYCDIYFKKELSKYYDKITVNKTQVNKYKFEDVLVLK